MSLHIIPTVRVRVPIRRGDVTSNDEYQVHPFSGDTQDVFLATRTEAPFERAYFYAHEVTRPLFDALLAAQRAERAAADKARQAANPPTLHPAQWAKDAKKKRAKR